MNQLTRSEENIFIDLMALCCQSGYIHAVAYLYFRDNVILYKGDMKEENISQIFSRTRLIRTEINTLIGLMIKAEIDWTLPPPKVLQDYIKTTDRLLEELHHCLSGDFFSNLTKDALESDLFNLCSNGKILREPIFYSGEVSYTFQYLDLATRKYAADAPWLEENCGFTIDQASCVAKAIEDIQTDCFDTILNRKQHPDEWAILPFFSFTTAQVVAKVNLSVDVVELVLGAFEIHSTERNLKFNSLCDFNIITARPLLRMQDGEFLSLQSYSLAEAIYDAPFYWMVKDKGYCPTLTKNRGNFTEHFVAERLSLVFGTEHVYLNVDIFETDAKKVSEVDVLVIWGDRLIVVQAKSKCLTLNARKGNDQVIREDFMKAVQAAYDQGALCAESLLGKCFKCVKQQGQEVALPHDIKEIYLFCVVSDHYPALSFQTRQLLKVEDINRVQAPLVMDVFTIDVITEMLQSPLQFLSYVNRRAKYADQLIAANELNILGYHLSYNLWMEPNVDGMLLHDDFLAGLDIAMAVRRAGLQGADTPDGILTRFENTTVGCVVKDIEARPDPAIIDLGLQLLALKEQEITKISLAIDQQAARTQADGKMREATFSFEDDCGVTFHCTDEPAHVGCPRLESYCKLRKYKEKAPKWFGLCITSRGFNVRFGISLSYPWIQDAEMDEKTQKMMPINQALQAPRRKSREAKKIGRNAPCPCGSGRKYKKCCLNLPLY